MKALFVSFRTPDACGNAVISNYGKIETFEDIKELEKRIAKNKGVAKLTITNWRRME
jgi:hypothetical protein